MNSFQFSDIPQIPIFGEEQADYDGQYMVRLRDFQERGTSHTNDESLEILNFEPMRRFMHGIESAPFASGLLHADLDKSIYMQRQVSKHYNHSWPVPEHLPDDSRTISTNRTVSTDRTISTDQTSVHSNNTPQNELHLQHSTHAASYGSPVDFSQAAIPYPTLDSFNDKAYSAELPLPGNSINLRHLEIHYEEAEPATEEHDHVSSLSQFKDEQEPVYTKTEAVLEGYNNYSDTVVVANNVRDTESVQPIIQSDDDSDYAPGKNTKRRRSSILGLGLEPKTQRCGRRGRKSSNASTHLASNRVGKMVGRGSSASINVYKTSNGSNSCDARPFPCPLAGYGCYRTYSSKNEWKRHVGTQHIKLGFWRCDLCPVQIESNIKQSIYYNDFNRRDLFTQHLRRMHMAQLRSSARCSEQYPVTEENLTEHLNRCHQILRATPSQSSCLFCDRVFIGPNSWEERMEHVGRHLEKDRNKISLDYKDWNTDRELEKYLLDEGIIEQNRNGEFTLPTLSLRSHNPPRFSSESTIPRYGICSKQTHAFTPLSQVPSLCGSSVPSANTIPEKLPSFLSIQQDHGTQIKAPNHSRNLETIPKPSLKVDEKDDGIASNSLLAWLDDTPDGTPPENVGSHLDKEENLTTPENSQFDVHSQVASVSVSETWGDSSSSDGSDTWMHPKISQQLPLAVKDLYAYFREWQKNAAHQARGSEQETNQSGASPLTNTTSSCSQINGGRTNKDSNKRRSSDEDENRASKNARLDSSSDRDDTRLLACPFAKKNPLQHRKCFKYVLQEIARLKQHLLRVHQVPIHCVRCSKTFDTVEARDYHSRQPECIVQPPRIFEGIDEAQRRQLGKRISSKKSREENWYLIYQILFPDAARPDSPFIEDLCLSEELLAIREFATQAAPARITQFANSQLPLNLRSNQQQIELFTQAAVREVFDMILENWDNCQLGQPSIENTTHRSTPGSSHDSGYSTTGPLPGNCYASQVTSRNFINSPVPQPTFEPLSSIQPLNQITTARESDELDFEALFENIEHVPNDGLFDAIN